jgi:hypothetical protein
MVITFPQGTTKSFKPVRKGTAILLDTAHCCSYIVIDGFRRSFDKRTKNEKRGILQSFIVKNHLILITTDTMCRKKWNTMKHDFFSKK